MRSLFDNTNNALHEYVYGDHDEDEEDQIDWAFETRPFLARNPHLVMGAGGFDECRVLSPEEAISWGWDVPRDWGDRIDGFDVPLRRQDNKKYLFFRKPTGQWFYLARHGPDILSFVNKQDMGSVRDFV